MCDPITITMVAATVASTAATVYSGVSTAKAERAQAKVDVMNAAYADRQRVDAMDRGARDQLAHFQRVSRLAGEQAAAASANGVDISFGSPLDIATDTAVLGNADADTLAMNTAREASGFDMDALNLRLSAEGHKAAGKAALIGTALSATGQALSGFAGAAQASAKYGGAGGSKYKALSFSTPGSSKSFGPSPSGGGAVPTLLGSSAYRSAPRGY